MLEEASWERYLYAYKETVRSFNGGLCEAGHSLLWLFAPEHLNRQCNRILQYPKYEAIHIFDFFCAENIILHKRILPKTPWHNGKVERSHRSDQERFYNHLSFYSFENLQLQMKNYLHRSNRIPTSVLGWRSPIQRRKELLPALFDTLFG